MYGQSSYNNIILEKTSNKHDTNGFEMTVVHIFTIKLRDIVHV